MTNKEPCHKTNVNKTTHKRYILFIFRGVLGEVLVGVLDGDKLFLLSGELTDSNLLASVLGDGLNKKFNSIYYILNFN